jgi:hypothetical protein
LQADVWSPFSKFDRTELEKALKALSDAEFAGWAPYAMLRLVIWFQNNRTQLRYCRNSLNAAGFKSAEHDFNVAARLERTKNMGEFNKTKQKLRMCAVIITFVIRLCSEDKNQTSSRGSACILAVECGQNAHHQHHPSRAVSQSTPTSYIPIPTPADLLAASEAHRAYAPPPGQPRPVLVAVRVEDMAATRRMVRP